MKRLILAIALFALLPRAAVAQPYSTPPTIRAFAATGLSVPYTIGIVQAGGFQQVIQPGSVTLIDNMNACNAPQYPSCNFIYWAGIGTALGVTTSPQQAFQAGNAIVAFVTTTGGAITNVVTFFQASEVNDNLVPAGVTNNAFPIRLPICNLLRTSASNTGCQLSTGSLSGY